MVRGIRLLALTVATLSSIAACGGNNSNSPTPSLDKLPTIQYVGNSSCPTSGAAGPYFTASNGEVKPAPVNSLPPVGEAINEMPHTHIQPPATVNYMHNPPTSGCHYNLGYGDAPIQTGVYNQSVPTEYWVHNLEHGYIVVLYNCPNGCNTEFQQLRTWYHSLAPWPNFPYAKVIVLPYTSMDVPFAIESWDWYDPMPVFSLAEVQKFYNNHENNGAEAAGP